MYYGQFQDDKIIEQYFPDGYIGGCIDVGATTGIDINNTYHFEENGWYALCIEPNPEMYSRLKDVRKNTLNFAISNFNKDLVDFTIINMDGNESAISSLSVDNKLVKQHEDMGYTPLFKNIKVSTRTLDYCIENYYKYDKIDFLSIDTESTELDVLKGFDIKKWNPKVILVENNYNDLYIEDYLKDFGYIKDKRIEVNDYYIKATKKKFLIGPKLGDFFHMLYVVKCLSGSIKSDVYITDLIDEKFSKDLKYTYTDIYDIVKSQPYVDNFLIYDGVKDVIDLRDFRESKRIFNSTWYNIFHEKYNLSNSLENSQWLYGGTNDYKYYEDKIVIHFSKNRYDSNYDSIIEDILRNNFCVFLTNDIGEYNNFKFKHLLVGVKKCENFTEMYSIIEKCKFFIGNQSMPLALAHGLFKHHLGFLHTADSIHYKDYCNKNYYWFDDQKYISTNFDEIYGEINIENKIKNLEQFDTQNVIFNISHDTNLNRVNISCNTKISVYVAIYEYLINELSKQLIYSTLSNYNAFDSYWYSPTRELKYLNHIKIEIMYGEILLKEEIIKL